MDLEILSRMQFAVTAGFHFLFPPITIGLSVFLVLVGAFWLRTKDECYAKCLGIFLKLFSMLFAVGVATGIVMIFQFGTNWSIYSNFVGDVFGSPLAIEAVIAFFLESTFLGIAIFGWRKIGDKKHFFAIVMVCVGAHLSSLWILTANSFMQTPAGFVLEKNGVEMSESFVPNSEDAKITKAKITSFADMVFSPSTVNRVAHTVAASWLSGAFLALALCGYFSLRKKDFSIPCGKIALVFAVFSAAFMLFTGDRSARQLAETQPEKLAAFEGHFHSNANAPFYILGWVNEKKHTVSGLKINGFYSLFAFGNLNSNVTGLLDLPDKKFLLKLHPNASDAEIENLRPNYWAPVNMCFQSFRIMVFSGLFICVVLLMGVFLWLRKILFRADIKISRLYSKLLIPCAILPLIASQTGWICAEVGRQPWIVWHILKTKDAVSYSTAPSEVLFSLLMFGGIFIFISASFVYLFIKKTRDFANLE